MITGHLGLEWSLNHRTGRCFTGHVRRTDEVWYSLYPFHTPLGSLEQWWRRLSRTDDQQTNVFGSFFIRYTSIRIIR